MIKVILWGDQGVIQHDKGNSMMDIKEWYNIIKVILWGDKGVVQNDKSNIMRR